MGNIANVYTTMLLNTAGYLKMNWLRWISRVSLLAAGLLPIIYYVYFFMFDLQWELKDWDWSIAFLIFFCLLLAIPIFTWKYPVAGGVISLFAVFVWLILEYAYMLFKESPTWFDYYYHFHRTLILEEWSLLLIGGILSIIWGRRRKAT